MAEIGLQGSGIDALVGQRVAAGMPQHVRMDLSQARASSLAKPDGVNGPPRSEAKTKGEADWRLSLGREIPTASHDQSEYRKGDVHTQTIESVCSMLSARLSARIIGSEKSISTIRFRNGVADELPQNGAARSHKGAARSHQCAVSPHLQWFFRKQMPPGGGIACAHLPSASRSSPPVSLA
jgi:hypothetical protein